ncbi:MAG: MFS transporter [Crocinitomicaceae bacterium]|nr:MFS transporter [Crocinitomicaceae bacterium]
MKKFLSLYISSFKGLSVESWMLSLVMLINRTGGMVIPFLTVYLTSVLGFKTDQAGLAMSFFGVGSLLGSILGGWLTDRIGAFYVQFFTLILSAPLFVLLSHITEPHEVYLTIFILSTIYESFRPANSAAITSYAKKGNITRSFSLNRLAINLGFSMGPALGGFLATFSYAWLFYGNGFAVFTTAIVFFVYFFKRKSRNENTIVNEEVNPYAFEQSPYKDKWYVLFSVYCFLFSCIFFQLISILPLFYKQVLNFSQLEIGLLLGFNGLFVVFTEMILVSSIEKKINIYVILMLSCLFLAFSYLWLLFDSSLLSCFFAMSLLSVAEILALPFMSTVAAKRSVTKNRGAYMGLNGLSISAAFIVMPYLSTLFIEHYSFAYLWVINIIILIITGIGFLYVRNKMPLAED